MDLTHLSRHLSNPVLHLQIISLQGQWSPPRTWCVNYSSEPFLYPMPLVHPCVFFSLWVDGILFNGRGVDVSVDTLHILFVFSTRGSTDTWSVSFLDWLVWLERVTWFVWTSAEFFCLPRFISGALVSEWCLFQYQANALISHCIVLKVTSLANWDALAALVLRWILSWTLCTSGGFVTTSNIICMYYERPSIPQHQHTRVLSKDGWQGVGMGKWFPRNILKVFDFFFPTRVICSTFCANGIIGSMNALGKGKKYIKSVKVHSYKWMGRFTTFSPESDLSAIHAGLETGRSELWLNYT